MATFEGREGMGLKEEYAEGFYGRLMFHYLIWIENTKQLIVYII